MKTFILAYYWAKTFNRNLYYCNHKKRYFYLGHRIPTKCCTLIKIFSTNPIQEILLSHIHGFSEDNDKLKETISKMYNEGEVKLLIKEAMNHANTLIPHATIYQVHVDKWTKENIK